MPDLFRAFSLVRFLGETGFYREIGLSVDVSVNPPRSYLTLGDLKSVTSSHVGLFGVLHTHTPLFSNQEKRIMGWSSTLAPEAGKEYRATKLVLFSDKDVETMAVEAENLLKLGKDVPLLYQADSRTYQNWVQHPYGFSRIEIRMEASGKVRSVDIRYVVYAKEGLDSSHLGEAQKLKAWLQGRFPMAEIKMKKVTVEELEGELKHERGVPSK
jgi:hypothetical protein